MLSYCFIAFIHLGHRRLKLIQFSMSEDIPSGPELLGQNIFLMLCYGLMGVNAVMIISEIL